ncbi:MAG: hypothetical protein J1F36_00285 [Clostridiales bacterium]|nr:hypothetical protein [Clostridiales bacterium]
MSIQDSLDDSVDLENRSPQSTRLFTKIAILASTVDLLLFFVCVVTYQIDEILGLNVFGSVFLPMVILIIIALYLAIAERLRAKYLGARIAIIISCLVFILVITFVIIEYIKYGKIYIAPFNPPPVWSR